jgi:uncharacterized protein (TIGR02302 family)
VRPEGRIRFLRALAWLVLAWETIWPALVPALCIIGLVLAFALADLPAAMPGWAHLAALVLFALALLAAAWLGLRRLRLPEPAQARRRVEIASGLDHRPLAALDDTPAGDLDPAGMALWQRHQARLRAALDRLRTGWPHPGVPARDPWAVRIAVLLLLTVAVAGGGHEAWPRLARAMTPDLDGPPPPPPEIEAWLNPPAYTGLPPIRLSGQAPLPVPAPAGREVIARQFGGAGAARLLIDGAPVPFERIDRQNQQLKHTLEQGREVAVHQDEQRIAGWQLDLIADQPPTVSLPNGLQVTQRNAMRFEYQANDDYGIARVFMRLRRADAAEGADDTLELPLPMASAGASEARDSGFHDLTPHPWAGLEVSLQAVAVDTAGQEGRGKEHRLVLPQRQFTHPVARAVIEQRLKLVRDPAQQPAVARALDAIASLPDTYDHDLTVYLALTTAARRLAADDGRIVRDEMVDLLWDTALRIEDGGLSLAERELRQAQRALNEALDRDAGDEEIERLMDQLQQAMDKYLQAMAEQARKLAESGQQPQRRTDPNARQVEAQDLRRMLERARELSRMGARDAAREMLRQLQEMLENMRAGTMTAQPGQDQPGESALRDLSEVMRGQQRLLDRTFRQDRDGQGRMLDDRQRGRQGQQGEPGEQGQPGRQPGEGEPNGAGSQALSAEQEALRRQLGEIMRQLGESMGDIPGGLGRAERAMRDAYGALQRRQGDQAVQSQTEAIDQLTEGVRELARRMQEQMGDGDGMPSANRNDRLDPAGRPLQDGAVDTDRVAIPDDWEMQRAREIQQELRRRAGERDRPAQERAYIDRLLRRF